ncbi:MAG TPA: hypothetical protein VH120_01395 [Gemmataceae bacterium]|jgi:hypothetical protein|nr:hypothetical protein [Gemmataceae bacterium]
MGRTFVLVLAGGLLAGLAAAEDAKQTGTQPGQILPGPYTTFVVSNPDAPKPPEGVVSEERANLGDLARVGKFHDLVTYYGLDPTVAVFSRQLPQGADQPLGKLLKALDQAVAKNRNARLHAFAVFLTLRGPFLEDVNQPVQVQQIRDFGEQLKLATVPLALDRVESDQSKTYDIPADATVVVLVYVNHKVEARHVFTADKPLDDAAIQTILGDANKSVGKK